MTALHTIGILSTSFTWNVFPTILEFPNMMSTCWPLFLHSAVQLIPNHRHWVEVGWFWRPGHLLQHSITLLLGQIALTQPGGVLGHCPVEKQMIVPLSENQMGWRIAAECFDSLCWLSVPWILNKSQTLWTAKHSYTITPPCSMLHCGNHTCSDHSFTDSTSHKDTAVGTKNLKFELIRPKDRCPLV